MHPLGKVRSLTEWPAVREEIEETVRGVLGETPKERIELQLKTVDELSFPTYTRRRVNYFVDEWERVSAWLFVPEGREDAPGILCCHHMVPQGKDEPAGIEGDARLAFAKRFAEQGYVTIAPDCIGAGERTPYGLEPYDTASFYKDYPKLSAMGKMLLDYTCALDALCEVKEVDESRLGVIGHGFGAYNGLLVAAFDKRIQCCVATGGLTRFADDRHAERWSRDSGFVPLPKLRRAIQEKSFPFDWEHILALVAPSPTLILTAVHDALLGNRKSCEKAIKSAGTIYKLLGAPDVLNHLVQEDPIGITAEALEQIDDWFERWL